MHVTLSPKARPTRQSNTITAFWHQHETIVDNTASAFPQRAEAAHPAVTIRSTFDLFRPSPQALRTRSSLGSLSARSSTTPTNSPQHERRSLDLEDGSGAIARELSRTGSFRAKMAFALGNAPQAQARQAAELQEVTTEKLGFVGIDGDKKIRLLPSAWATDALPPPTATLLSISSSKGLVAAASPDALVVATTDSVRQAFHAKSDDAVKPFTPQLTIPIPRVSQVAFSSDGKHLVICAEQGGGLAVYDTQALLSGNKESAFQIATNGVAVRALAPNPNPDLANGVALVLTDGKLMVADLNTRQFQQGPQGSPVLREGVSCVAWSNKGKQMVAGLGDGSAVQMDVQSVKASIPRPPALQGDQFLERIVWVANEEFITVHTPVDADTVDPSTFTYISREKGTQNYSYQALSGADTFQSMTVKRTPQHYYFSRLRQFPPDITDLLVVASSASIDVNVLGKSGAPLSADTPAVNTYNTITFAEDSKRAAMPQNDMEETSCIGAVFDLSSKDKVSRPIAGDEIDESPHPLPAYLALNHEGVLSGWWMVYTDSIRQNTPYSELTALQSTPSAAPLSATTATPSSPFATAASSSQQPQSLSGFAKPQQPAFGQSAFGSTPTGTGAFGGTSSLGIKSSPWASPAPTGAAGQQAPAPAFGKPAFGAPAFGSASPIGATSGGAFASTGKSLWGTPATSSETQTKPAVFGNNTSTASPFSSFASVNKDAAASPFATTAKQGASPFGSLGTPSGGSSFGMKTEPSFGSTVTVDSSTGGSTLGTKSIFGGASSESFGAPAKPATSLIGQQTPAASSAAQETDMADDAMDDEQPSQPTSAKPAAGFGGFTLGSTFKPDNQVDKDEVTPDKAKPANTSLFGGGFGNALPTTMEKPEQPVTPSKEQKAVESTTPATPAAPPSAPKSATASLPAVPESPQKTPEAPLAGSSPEQIEAPDSPLSPAPSSEGEVVDDAPLPPDPGTVKKPAWFNEKPPGAAATPAKPPVTNDAPLPPDPSTVKKPSWFNENPPGAATPAKLPLFETPPAAAKLPPTLEAPKPQSAFLSTTPAGLPKGMVLPPPATKPPRSPRSPSPVRSASTPARRGTPRLSSQPFIQQPPIQFSQQSAPQGISVPPPTKQPSRLSSTTSVPPAEPEPQPEEELTAADLADGKAEGIRSILLSPVKPSRTLGAFEAHQDYTGGSDKSQSIARQMEQIYRDVNDMVDTVGLNARTLEAWVLWNVEMSKGNVHGEQRERPDLRTYRDALGSDREDEVQWALAEAQDLGLMLDDMAAELRDGCVEDARAKTAALGRQMQDLASLRKKIAAIRRFVADRAAGDTEAATRRPRGGAAEDELSPQARQLQQETRQQLADVKKQLAEAEDALLILKSRLASRGRKAPTVEAVTSTIQKVTDVVMERGADVDVLEMQMRKLGILNEAAAATAQQQQSLSASWRSSVRAGATPGSPVRRRGGAAGGVNGSREGTPTTPLGRSMVSRFSRMSVESGASPVRPGTAMSSVGAAPQSQDERVRRFLVGKKKRMAVKEALMKRLDTEGATTA